MLIREVPELRTLCTVLKALTDMENAHHSRKTENQGLKTVNKEANIIYVGENITCNLINSFMGVNIILYMYLHILSSCLASLISSLTITKDHFCSFLLKVFPTSCVNSFVILIPH